MVLKAAWFLFFFRFPSFRRETSNEDGVAIAWSVAEHLISKGALTFFATHYPQICDLSKVYPAVRNLHLGTSMPRDGNGEILYTHKIQDGPCVVASDYGVHVAASTGFPQDVVAKVRTTDSKLLVDTPAFVLSVASCRY